MELKVTTLEGKAAGSVQLSDAIFGLEPRKDIIQRCVNWQLAKRQAGTHKTQGRADVWRFEDGNGGEIAVRVCGRIEANTGELLSDAALAGFGIALHSTWHVREDLRTGRLVQVLPNFPMAVNGIYAVMPQRRLVPPRVRAFVDFLADRWRDNSPDAPWTS